MFQIFPHFHKMIDDKPSTRDQCGDNDLLLLEYIFTWELNLHVTPLWSCPGPAESMPTWSRYSCLTAIVWYFLYLWAIHRRNLIVHTWLIWTYFLKTYVALGRLSVNRIYWLIICQEQNASWVSLKRCGGIFKAKINKCSQDIEHTFTSYILSLPIYLEPIPF